MSVEDVALAECRGLLENDCENMKLQITDHMKVYMEEKGIEDILEMITSGDKAMEDASGAVEMVRMSRIRMRAVGAVRILEKR